MLRLALLLLFLGVATSQAAPDGHCMALKDTGGCRQGKVTDSDRVLLPGVHVYFSAPTRRYRHGVFGDEIEWGELTYVRQGSAAHGPYIYEKITLPKSRVFEDLAPRLIDLDGDGNSEIVLIETHVNKGAQLAVYDLVDQKLQKIASTPHIGRTHRWLAPIGAADLDGDGYVELAYIDRPHLAKLLKIWRYKDGKLKLVAEAGNLTNHQFGDDYISGGIRDCGNGPEMVTANANWSEIMISRFDGTKITAQKAGTYTGLKSINRAMRCR